MGMLGNIAVISYITQLLKFLDQQKNVEYTEISLFQALKEKLEQDKKLAEDGWL